ncbi:HEAT repeat domain-containing protein, partial [Candidatus Woesearchaeota archaeon]|nr:HEAT repeat domain-containing protein [Candidatus Woesearchaeota archaeon]
MDKHEVRLSLIENLENTNGRIREEIVGLLGKLGDDEAVIPLIDCLTDGDEHIRQASAIALGRLGDKRAVVPLVKCLADSEQRVRDERATRPLIEHLTDGDWLMWVDISEILEGRHAGMWFDISGHTVVPAPHNVLDDVRSAVAEALGRLGDASAVVPLI